MSALTDVMVQAQQLREDGLPGNVRLYRVHTRYQTMGGEWKWQPSDLYTRGEAIRRGTELAGGGYEVKIACDLAAHERYAREADKRKAERG